MKPKKISSLMLLGRLVLALSLCLAVPIQGETRILKAGVLDFPPYYIVKSENDVTGSLADVIRRVLDRAGFQYVLNGYPPKRLYKNLADGTTQVWLGVSGVPEYEGKVLYSNIKVEEIEVRLYTLEGKPLLKSLENLKGKTVIIQRGYGYGGIITFLEDPRNSITADYTDGHDLAFRKLLKGRADYLLDYRQPAEALIRKERFSGVKSSPIKTIGVYFIVSKKAPDAENLLKKMDAAYLALKKEGAFK